MMHLLHARSSLLVLALCCAGCAVRPTQATPSATAAVSLQPTATAATPTAAASPAPTALAPAPRQFSEPFSSKLVYWHFLQVDNGQPYAAPSVQDGFLMFSLSSANQWAYALYSGAHYQDVKIEAEVQNRTTGDGGAGLVCRYDEKKGWYEFNVFADQTYQLLYGQWLAPGLARYTPLFQGKSEAIRGDTNQIGLLCQGNSLEPFVNGAPLRQLPELKFGLQQGEVGLSASSFVDAPYMAAFDWATVSEP